jgi:hypothetical protein
MKAKKNWKNIKAYFQGNIRHWLYYHFHHRFIREHIKEQYVFRTRVMRKSCYDNGACDECGCATTNLQFANKACDGKCYPHMMNKEAWEWYKTAKTYKDALGQITS